MQFFDLTLYDHPLENLTVFNKGIINTLNAYSFYLNNHKTAYNIALKQSDILLADGKSICTVAYIILHKKLRKISGYDFLFYSLKQVNKKGGKVCFFGSCDKTLNEIERRIEKEFPDIQCQTINPGFDSDLKTLSKVEFLDSINKFSPDILYVGLGAPKQELWVNKVKDNLNAGTICSVGAAFDYFAGTKKRPSDFWINLGFEGIIRTIKEPKTQIKKDIKAYPYLIYRLLKEKIKKQHSSSKNLMEDKR